MGSSEIWDKYHESYIGNGKILQGQSQVKLLTSNTKRVVFIPNFATHILFYFHTILTDFHWCFHACDLSRCTNCATKTQVTLFGATQ